LTTTAATKPHINLLLPSLIAARAQAPAVKKVPNRVSRDWNPLTSSPDPAISQPAPDATPPDLAISRQPYSRASASARFTNKQGTRITPTFDSAFDFHEGLAAVEVGDKVGYIQ